MDSSRTKKAAEIRPPSHLASRALPEHCSAGLVVTIEDDAYMDTCDKNREQERFMRSTRAKGETLTVRVKGDISNFFVTLPEAK
jgi:hypothetical protein